MLNTLLAMAAMAAGAVAETRHTVVAKDTLWDLAGHYYKDSYKWRRIADANPAPNVKDPHWIYPGQVIIIPDIEASAESAAPVAPVEPPAAVEAPPPAPEEAPQMTAEPQAPPPPPAKPVDFQPDKSEGTVTLPESLSTNFPTGLVAAPPSNYRMMALPGWSPDGQIAGLEGREAMAAEGDAIDLLLEKGSAKSGDRFAVFRRAAAQEADVDKKATYVVKIGVVQVRRPLGANRFRAIILKSSDSMQLGDVLVRGE